MFVLLHFILSAHPGGCRLGVGAYITKLEKQSLEIFRPDTVDLLHTEKGLSLGESFLLPRLGVLRTENPLVIPVTDAAASDGNKSWYFLWRSYLGLRSNPLC